MSDRSFVSSSPDRSLDPLTAYGWTDAWSARLRAARDASPAPSPESLHPARVVFASRDLYRVVGHWPFVEADARPDTKADTKADAVDGLVDAHLAGRLRRDHALAGEGSDIAVGDWALVEPPASSPSGSSVRIVGRLPRSSRLARKVPGERTRVQVVAANVDTVFIVMGLDGDYNPRRVERFVAMAVDGGVAPVVVLTKADLHDDATVDAMRWPIRDASPGLPVHAVATLAGRGLEPLRAFLERGSTISLVGSSGAGKSTLVNALAGEDVMKTGAVRESDDRGRHTTTHRQLLRLPGREGALLIDNPGIRELQLWTDDGDAGLAQAFDDVDSLAQSCRFSDCRHLDEPGCAVLAAVDQGTVDSDRLDSWHKLQRELEHLELRQDDAERRRRAKGFGKMAREAQQMKRRSRR